MTQEIHGSLLAAEHFETFAQIGRDLFLTGAVSTHGGNLSMRVGDSILISRRGAPLGMMRPGDVCETTINPSPTDAVCSRELVVHRAIYHACDAQAIVHAHTIHTVFRSFLGDVIEPIDSESKYVIGERITVHAPEQTIASPEAAKLMAASFRGGERIAVLRSHGPFAVGESLAEAFYHVSCLEASAAILDLRDSTGARF